MVTTIDDADRPVTRLDALSAVERECAGLQEMIRQTRRKLDDGEALVFRAREVAVGERAAAIGIGAPGISRRPLPHHRTCGSASGGSRS